MRNTLWMLAILLISACNNTQETTNKENNSSDSETENINPVKVEILQPSYFAKQLVSNGKLASVKKSSIAFKVSGRINEIKVGNGNLARKGETIALLENTQYKQAYDRAKINLDKASLDLENLLIGLGWELADSAKVPSDILQVAKTRSGYAAALLEMKNAIYDLENTAIKAPFTGLVANIKHKVFEQVNAGATFCLIIDNSQYEVEFKVLETEISQLKIGKDVSVVPYVLNKEKFYGSISEINPVIDEYGMVNVRAVIKGSNKLMEGMNVNIFVETDIPDQLVVPRSAVMLRDGFNVLFKYTKGRAYWTYVLTTNENSETYSVIANPDKNAELDPGDTIIIEGNMYLAHDSRVEIVE